MYSIVDACRRPLLAGAIAVALALAGMTGVASADRLPLASASGEVVVKRGDRGDAVTKIQQALDIRPADGIFGPHTETAVKSFQRRNELTVDGIVGPQTRTALGLAPFSRSSVRGARGRRLPRILHRIAECESGGNPRAVSPGGDYRGKYQFSLETWRSLGGRGDPAAAPERRQDRLALRLYRRSGNTPWPNCP